MRYVTEIYNDKGKLVEKVSECDHDKKWGMWRWREVVAGVLIAVIALGQWAIWQ